MTVAAVEAAVAVKQQHEDKKKQKAQKKAADQQGTDAPDQAPAKKSPATKGSGGGGGGGLDPSDYGAGPAPQKKTDRNGNATFRGSGGRKRGRSVAWAFSGSRKVLTAQFVLCVVILVLGTLTSKDEAKSSAARAMVKGSALALLFFLLALLSSAGGASAKAATAMGTLVTTAYALTSSDVHAVVKWLTAYFKNKAPDVGGGTKAGDNFASRWWTNVEGQVDQAEQELQQAAVDPGTLTDTGGQ